MSGPIAHAVRRLRAPMLLVVLAVAVVAGVVALLGSTGSLPSGLSGQQAQEDPTDEPTTAQSDLVESITARVSSYEVFLARDPFEPVIPEAAGTADGGGTTDPGTTPTTAPTTSPDDGTDGDGTDGDGTDGEGTDGDGPTDGNDGCVTNENVSCDGRTVSLVDVFTENGTDKANVRVDETLYEVVVGQQFAENFVVGSIEPPCVTLQFGDDHALRGRG